MEFYLSIEGEKKGPFTQFKVEELIRDGEISHKNLGWHRGMKKWIPVSEIPALEGVFREEVETDLEDDATEAPGSEEISFRDSDEAGGGNSGGSAVATMPLPGAEPRRESTARRVGIALEVKPFVRFWARTFDYMLVTGLVFLFSDIEFAPPGQEMTLQDLLIMTRELVQQPEYQMLVKMQLLAMLVWHVVEGLMIHVFGTTPGKALFGIRVRGVDGRNPPVMPSLARSFIVYVLGAGFYYSPFSLIAMTFGFFRLMARGQTIWDQNLKMVVEHPPMGFVRILVAIGAFFVLITLQGLKF